MLMSVRELDDKTFSLPKGTRVHLRGTTASKPSFGVQRKELYFLGNDGVGAVFSPKRNTKLKDGDYLHYSDLLSITDEGFDDV